jgi:DNA polymerase-4
MEWLERWFGPRRARWLWERVRGRDPTPVNPSEPRKSISSEKTFSSDLVDDGTLEGELLKLVTSVGAPLRRKNLQGRTITVKIRDKDFQTRQASHSLPDPIVSDAAIYSVARQLFRELRARRRTGVRLLGVGISSLAPGEGPPQLDLFQEGVGIEPERDRTISRLMDDLRERFGDEAILPGRFLERGNAERMGEGSHLRGQDDR